MCMFPTMHTRIKIKTLINKMANLIITLEFHNCRQIWRSTFRKIIRWIFIEKYSTLKLNEFWVIWNEKYNCFFVSKAKFMLVINKYFPRSNNGLRKTKLNIVMVNNIFIKFFTVWSRLLRFLNITKFRIMDLSFCLIIKSLLQCVMDIRLLGSMITFKWRLLNIMCRMSLQIFSL